MAAEATVAKPITLRWAITHALDEEMDRDESVWLLGQDIGASGGTFGLTRGLYDKYGAARVHDTPISEEGIADMAVGAAMTGTRPVLEIMFGDFMALTMDAMVNQAAKTRYLSGGQMTVPLVVRTLAGAGFRAGAHHSQSFEAWFTHVPGLKVAYPSTPADAKGLLKSAIRDDNPVVFFEPKALFSLKGQIPEGEHLVPLGQAEIRRSGEHVTLVTWGRMAPVGIEAAETLAGEGIDVEVIDPRTLLPLDKETILESVAKTGQVVILHEAPVHSGFGAEIAALIADEALFHLDAPVKRLGSAFSPIPIGNSEDLLFPTAERVADEIRALVNG
jgi:acetoin:2,6-dichlorophenolindophenol oxidoreductase subunit beta